MKHLITNPISSFIVMFVGILAVILLWATYRPEIQNALRVAQRLIFG